MAFSHVVSAQEKALKILNQFDLTQSQLSLFLTKYPELLDLDASSNSQVAFEGENPEIFTVKIYAENSDDVYIIQKKYTQIEIEKIYSPLEIEVKTIEGNIRGTLFDSLKKETSSPRVANLISEAFKDEFISTKGLRARAYYSFDILEYFDNGHFVKYGDVMKASLIIGHAISHKILQQNLTTQSWNLLPTIVEKDERPFYAPVKSSRVSSLFQLNRRHPVTRRIQPHNGIDFVTPSGSPVYPALDGRIVSMGRARAKGKFIIIEHDNGYKTTYDHLKKFQKGLRVGTRVEMQDKIGEVGRTGYATGAHLHFGVLNAEGFYVNPIDLVKEYTFDFKDSFENSNPESLDAEENPEE